MTNPHQNDPVDLSEVPDGVDPAVAAEDVEDSPEEKRNATDPEQEDALDQP